METTLSSMQGSGSTTAPSGTGTSTKGSDGLTGSMSFDGQAVDSGLVDRFRRCDQTTTQLSNDEKQLDVTGPWAGDRRTFLVRAGADDTGESLAARLLADPQVLAELRHESFAVDSITLLTSTGVGLQLQRALAEGGFPVRVYEAT